MLRAISAAESPALAAEPEDFLTRYAETYRFSHGKPTLIRVAPAGDGVYYLRSGPRSFTRDLYAFDPQSGKESLVATAESLIGGDEKELTPEEAARRERMRLAARGVATFDLSKDGTKLLIPLSGRLFLLDRATGKVNELASAAGDPLDPQFSPDGKAVAYVRNGDLYVVDVASDDSRRLTTGASDALTHGLAEFVAQEEMGRMHGYWWSPDSRQIAYQQTDESPVEELFISDPANPGKPPQRWRYPRPGKANAEVRLFVVSVDCGEPREVAWDRDAYPYLANVVWSEGAPLTLVVQNRRQTEELVLAIDNETLDATELLRERDDAWINLDDGMPRWIRKGAAFLWSTERRGAWQLELRDRDGKLLGELTSPELGYRSLVAILEKQGEAIVAAGDNPTEVHLYRVSLDAEKPNAERMTSGPGLHGGIWSKDGDLSVRTTSNLQGEHRFDVYNGDGELLGKLPQTAESPGFAPTTTIERIADAPHLYAAVTRPRDFDSARRYPVIVSVYGGPHAQTVVSNAGKYLLDQWIADRGFIVVSIDGRGTPSRGRDFERAIKGDFITLPLADQVRGLQALGAKHPELDLTHVGIHGWSFGGYFTAMALLQRPDVFHVGVAGAPVVDWADYDTHYTERYLGLPDENAVGYGHSNVLSHADRLDGKLLLVHGTADDNVYFQHSVKLAEAFFRQGQTFEFLPLRGLTHMTPDPLVNRRLLQRTIDHLETHLLPARDLPR